MKPWLLNILACPICKHHPLMAYLFEWETPKGDLERAREGAGKAEAKYESEYGLLAKQLLDGTISPPAIRAIEDRTGNEAAAELLRRANEALAKLAAIEGKTKEDVVREFRGELDVVHRYFNLIEVDEGLLVCGRCGRWYPIGRAVEGVPEMLPDDLRERKELEFLRKWRERVPKEVLAEGKPFNLGGQ